MVRLQRNYYLGRVLEPHAFNPTMVRLQLTVSPDLSVFSLSFQSHYGAIATMLNSERS